MLDVLRAVDPTFRELPHAADGRRSTRFRASSGFLVEFLTSNTGSVDYEERPAPMPALGGAFAEPLRFLDFLIHEPMRAALLHGSGIPVLVPSPERYAVHKLIVGPRRRADGAGKAAKDRRQASTLLRPFDCATTGGGCRGRLDRGLGRDPVDYGVRTTG